MTELYRVFDRQKKTLVWGAHIEFLGTQVTVTDSEGYPVKDAAVTRRTDVKDSRGDMIYEGDMLSIGGITSCVSWNPGISAFVAGRTPLHHVARLGAVIIGNIHGDMKDG